MNGLTPSLAGKKLVVFDYDGTLARSKQPMQPSTAGLLARLLERVKVAIISGGGYAQFQAGFLSSFYPLDSHGLTNLYLLPTYGTRFLEWRGEWRERYREDLADDDKKRIMGAFEAAFHAIGYARPERTFGEVIEDRGSQVTFSALGQEAPIEIKESWDPDRSKREAIADAMRPKLPGFDVRVGGTTSIDVTKRGVNKAYGIQKLEHYLDISAEEIVFVGDKLFLGGNDYPARATGVDCIQVSGPEETERIIQGWLF